MKNQQEFRKEINGFVESIFGHYKPKIIKRPKIIHEAIQGSSVFYEHEISLIDTPLLQRLHQIHQTGLSFFTYPTAIHTRFDHSLGVATLINKFVNILNKERDRKDSILIDEDPYKGDFANLRIAALLHDCGHTFLSHTSEEIYRTHCIIKQIKKTKKFSSCRPHEILSYYIVLSTFFKKWFEENILNHYGVDINLETVADMIIGIHRDPSKIYLAEIINGPFDADKLDYIKRDGFFSGLKIVVDEERLFYTLTTRLINGKRRIVLKSPIPMEQIVFSKIVLSSSMYYHQKVMACHAMISAIIDYMNDPSSLPHYFFEGNSLNNPVDYLRLTDYDILRTLSLKKNKLPNFIQETIWNLFQRNLYIRALTISALTIENWEETFPRYIGRLMGEKNERDKLRRKIYSNIPNKIKKKYNLILHQIQLSFPKPPLFDEENDETLSGYVVTPNGNYITLNSLFPIKEWVKSYIIYKWKGYIFCPPYDEVRDEICKIAKDILKNEGIKIK